MINLYARISVALVPIAAAVVLVAESNSFTVKMRDDCDPKTFNAAAGPGTCVGRGETKFQEFLAEFQEDHKVDDWEFSPDHSTAKTGATLRISNRGGETHTFTKVAAFGGGFIPLLNGRLAPRPECAQAPGVPQPPSAENLFVPAGATVNGPTAGSSDLPSGATIKFQCCIHPWMRTEITAK